MGAVLFLAPKKGPEIGELQRTNIVLQLLLLLLLPLQGRLPLCMTTLRHLDQHIYYNIFAAAAATARHHHHHHHHHFAGLLEL